MTRPLDQVTKVPGLVARHGLSIGEYIDALARDQEAAAAQKAIIDEHTTDPDQNKYPILIHKKIAGVHTVIDGNRRTLRAAIYGQEHIEAWIGELSGTEPNNFWIPIGDMLQLVEVYKRALSQENKSRQQAAACILESQFALSSVADYAYRTRISTYDETARQLYEMIVGKR